MPVSIAKQRESRGYLADKAYRELLQRISVGELSSRDQLTETGLCEVLGMSRTPVRQALHRLVTEGLLESSPNRGVRVRELTIPDMIEMYLLREAIECQAARLAAQRITEEELRELYARCDEMDALSLHESAMTVYHHRELDAAFHHRLLELSGVRTFLDVYRRHHVLQIHIFAPNVTRILENVRIFAGRGEPLGIAHRRIVDAIATRDPQKAEDAIRVSVQTSIEKTRQGLQQLEEQKARQSALATTGLLATKAL